MNKLIENTYPSVFIDSIAEKESFRKEVYRPVYHTHKWWAQRLGSVFRAIVIGSVYGDTVDYEKEFYNKHQPNSKIIYDPFMGSGTTIGEALKLGIKAVGCDINPVSSFIVKQSLNNLNKNILINAFNDIEIKVKNKILNYYTRAHPITRKKCTVLYYFWVKYVRTPEGKEIPLFSNYIFSRNAYPKKHPEAKIFCPECSGIISDRYDTKELTCPYCNNYFNPQEGPVNRGSVSDIHTGKTYRIIDLVKRSGTPPIHKLYASLVLTDSGNKEYLPIDDDDLALYQKAEDDLKAFGDYQPDLIIEPGHNTKQVLNYNYTNWRQFFNSRQLLILNFLLNAIIEIKNKDIREQFLTLFSGTLEFNNMFCSFKGEGTGAVRHLFNNHILKPERTPLENNVWGTNKSSGTFSTLFQNRLLKAKKYLEFPFELSIRNNVSHKIYCNNSINPSFVNDYNELIEKENSCLILNGDSSNVNLPDKSIDAVVTDPPYFDFVHYSELSDFFYAWLKPNLEKDYPAFYYDSSRRQGEVQSSDEEIFSDNLSKVFKECYRVLKDDGVLVFSFHHSQSSGWAAIFRAIHNAGFYIKKSHIVKAEMSVATPKTQAKSPINLDALIVCKKAIEINPVPLNGYLNNTVSASKQIINELTANKRILSENDKKVIFYSQLIRILSQSEETEKDKLFKLIKEAIYTDINPDADIKSVKQQKTGIEELKLDF